MDTYIRRNIENRIFQAMEDTPVILIQGARQVGKSTLTEKITEKIDCKRVSLDDDDLLFAAENDPKHFVNQYPDGTLIIDEIQLQKR